MFFFFDYYFVIALLFFFFPFFPFFFSFCFEDMNGQIDLQVMKVGQVRMHDQYEGIRDKGFKKNIKVAK